MSFQRRRSSEYHTNAKERRATTIIPNIQQMSSYSFSPSTMAYTNYDNNWERHVDPASGLTYFANSFTGESRWSDDAKWIMMEQSRRATSATAFDRGYREYPSSLEEVFLETTNDQHFGGLDEIQRRQEWDNNHYHYQHQHQIHPWNHQDLHLDSSSQETTRSTSSSSHLQHPQDHPLHHHQPQFNQAETDIVSRPFDPILSVSPPSSLSPSTPAMFTPKGDAAFSHTPSSPTVHSHSHLSSSSIVSSSNHQRYNQNYTQQTVMYPVQIPVSDNTTRRRSLSIGAASRHEEHSTWHHQRFAPAPLHTYTQKDDIGSSLYYPQGNVEEYNVRVSSLDATRDSSHTSQSPSRGDRSSSRKERRRRAEKSILESRRFFAAAFHPNGIDASDKILSRNNQKGDSSSDVSESHSKPKQRVPQLYDTPPSSDVDVDEEVKNGNEFEEKEVEEDDENDDEGTLAEALADGAKLIHPDDDNNNTYFEQDDEDVERGTRSINIDVEDGLLNNISSINYSANQNEDEAEIQQIINRDRSIQSQSFTGKTRVTNANRLQRSRSKRARAAANDFVGMTLEQRAAWLKTQLTSVGGNIASDAYAVAAMISEKSVPWVQGFLGAVVIAAGVVRNSGLSTGGGLVGGVSAKEYVRTISAEAALQMSPTGEIPISIRKVHQQIRETNEGAMATLQQQQQSQTNTSIVDEGAGYATCEEEREEGTSIQTLSTRFPESTDTASISSSLSLQKQPITLTDVLFSAGAVKRLLRPCAEAVATSSMMNHCPPLPSIADMEIARQETIEKEQSEANSRVLIETIKFKELAGIDSGMAKEKSKDSFFASAPTLLSPSKLPI